MPGADNSDRLVIKNIYLFLLAASFLALILILGFVSDALQDNILFLIILSLSCAILFAFLPFASQLDLGWVKAAGTAAIFIFLVWLLVDFADKKSYRQFELKKQGLQKSDSSPRSGG